MKIAKASEYCRLQFSSSAISSPVRWRSKHADPQFLEPAVPGARRMVAC
jgi:hypothetical protein